MYRASILLVLLLALLTAPATPSDWPMFRNNPIHTGVFPSAEGSPITLTILWSYIIPEGLMFSSPTVSNGMVYVGSNFSSNCLTPGRIYAFKADTGALAWSFETKGSVGDASPAVINGTVIIGGGNTVYGLDALTGQVRWQQTFSGMCFQENFVTAVPELDAVFLGGVSKNNGYVFSFTSSGSLRFSYSLKKEGATSSAVFSAPTYVPQQGYIVFGSYNGRIYALDANNGSLRWVNTTPTTSRLYATTAYDPTEGHLYIGGFDGNLYALDSNGQTLWSFKTEDRLVSSAAVVWTTSGNKRIIVGSEDGYIYALDGQGNLIWKLNAGAAIYSSVAVQDSTESADGVNQPYTYFATYNGHLLVLDADGNLLAVNESLQTQGPVDKPSVNIFLATGLTWSSPAVANRRIFIATAGNPSKFFILGDNNLIPEELLTSGNLRSAEIGSFGDMSIEHHLPGVSLQPGDQWGDPTLLQGRSLREVQSNEARFTMNLKTGSPELTIPFSLDFTYKTDAPAEVYQYDGTQYKLLATLDGDGTWKVNQVITDPSLYVDYDGDPSNGINVMFKIKILGSYYYLDKLLMFRQPSAAILRVDLAGNFYTDGAYYCGLQNLPCFNSGLGADLAERINTSEPVEPGDVVELDPEHPGFYRKSRNPYSTLVVGVVAAAPGITIGQKAPRDKEDRPLLALIGVVPVKATIENGLIQPGDLLVASSTPGYAMRCSYPQGCEGMLIGKAVEPLSAKQGVIKMLLMK